MSIISFLDMKVAIAKKINPRYYRIRSVIRAINNFKGWTDEPATKERYITMTDQTTPAQSQSDYIRAKTSGTHMIFSSVKNPAEVVMTKLVEAKIAFKVLLGSYKTQRETSYLIGAEHLETIFASGLIEDEESILVLGNAQKNNKREAFLVFNTQDESGNSDIQHLGLLDVLSNEEAATTDAWSFDPTLSVYFGIRPLVA